MPLPRPDLTTISAIFPDVYAYIESLEAEIARGPARAFLAARAKLKPPNFLRLPPP